MQSNGFIFLVGEFPGGHRLIGNSNILQGQITGQHGFAGNTECISFEFPGGQRFIGKFVFLSNSILQANVCFPPQYGILHFIASICACFVSSSAWVYRFNSL